MDIQTIEDLERFCAKHDWIAEVFIHPKRSPDARWGPIYKVVLNKPHWDLKLLYGAGAKHLCGFKFRVEGKATSFVVAATKATTRAEIEVPKLALEDLEIKSYSLRGTWLTGPASGKWEGNTLPDLVETFEGKVYAEYRGRYSKLVM